VRLPLRLLLAAWLAAASSAAAAAEARPGALGGIPDELAPERARLALRAPPGLVGAPFVRYSPETAWGFGAAGMAWFHADPVARAAGRASTIGVAFQQTTRRQTVGALQWEAFLAEGTWRSAGAFFAERWPYDFWGVGAAAGQAAERYTQRTLKLDTALLRRVVAAGDGKGLWLGARAQWRRDGVAGAAPGGRIEGCAVDGCRGGQVVAAQAVVAWDTRDRICATEEGLLLTVRTGGALPELGSAVRTGELELDARGWRRLPWRRAVLAAQARLQAVSGPVPFYLLPTFGGDRSLRGVVEGRWRDRSSLVLQAELAVPLFWRLGLELFGGAGEAAARPAALSLRGLVPAGGAGLRFTVDPVERVFLRVDHGVSPGSSQWYLSIGQAI
jgi:hypothetical protein